MIMYISSLSLTKIKVKTVKVGKPYFKLLNTKMTTETHENLGPGSNTNRLTHVFDYSCTVCVHSSLIYEKNHLIHFHIGSYVKLCPVMVSIFDF
jgi:hypothetical protein